MTEPVQPASTKGHYVSWAEYHDMVREWRWLKESSCFEPGNLFDYMKRREKALIAEYSRIYHDGT